jgi:cyclic pyranopterin phosphate synthase
MKDRYGREIEYLRISVTDRCNFRCRYCMPEDGVIPKSHDDILTFEEMVDIVKAGITAGIDKIRVTGGEPLVRKGTVDFIAKLKRVSGIKDISMTTNGSLLSGMAVPLKKAGLDRVNISLDTLQPDRFRWITRTGCLAGVLKGMEKALDAGLSPVKVNCVISKGFNDDELEDFIYLTHHYPVHVRFIELMPLGDDEWSRNGYIPNGELIKRIKQPLKPVKGVRGNGPAVYYRAQGAIGTIGFISPLSQHFCGRCNRLRLTADGKLKPCLESDVEFDLKGVIRHGGGEEDIKRVFRMAVEAKPLHHNMVQGEYRARNRKMSQIGG